MITIGTGVAFSGRTIEADYVKLEATAAGEIAGSYVVENCTTQLVREGARYSVVAQRRAVSRRAPYCRLRFLPCAVDNQF